jgi:hypothetical protein
MKTSCAKSSPHLLEGSADYWLSGKLISSHLYIYTSIHLYIYTSIHLYIYTSIHLYHHWNIELWEQGASYDSDRANCMNFAVRFKLLCQTIGDTSEEER